MKWTPERIERLKTYVAEKKTGGQIAELFGEDYTRASVIGKAHRLGLAVGDGLRPASAKATPEPFWTTQRVADLKRLCALGQSARQTAAEIGCTENQARSKGARLGLAFKGVVAIEAPTAKIVPAILRTIDVASEPKPWTERLFGECCYPVSGLGDDVKSCCAKVSKPGVAWQYCDAHLTLMFARTRTPEQRAVDEARMANMRAAKRQRAA